MFYFECRECGYDSDEARCLSPSSEVATCPLCAGDTGTDGAITFREATPEEVARLPNCLEGRR